MGMSGILFPRGSCFTAVGMIEYTIPDEYLFDPNRFFRVRVEISE
jgi:hypothetical protein